MVQRLFPAFQALVFLSIALVVVTGGGQGHAQTETVFYSFSTNADGAGPFFVTPVLDKKGDLYGTTEFGGANGDGVVFKLDPSGTETILHSFDQNGTDGYYPYAGLVLDKKGNLYGTTLDGGAYGYGTVFKLTPSGAETILHSFDNNGTDGYNPTADLVLDKEGNLYGTTYQGGSCNNGYGCGTVFELTSSGVELILHTFGASRDGCHPHGGLVVDKEGNLYGTTLYGGAYDPSCAGNGAGTVFELTPSGGETILHNFADNGADGYEPMGGLVFDRKGNLYGTTLYGGAYGEGTVFKLTLSGAETILHSFAGGATDGYFPYASLVLGKKGTLYGTTGYGGAYTCGGYTCGTVFKLKSHGAKWMVTTLWCFGDGSDGQFPFGGLLFDKKSGNLYGMTYGGGAYGDGTLFELTP